MFDGAIGEILGNQWFQITMLLTVAVLSSFIFVRARLPKIVGQIVLGIIIGPSVLGLVTLD